MAVVTFPCLSVTASGKLGPLVFGQNKGRNTVRRLVTPANPRTVTQQGQRAFHGGLSKLWAALTADEKASWQEKADAGTTEGPISTFNAFMRANLKRFAAGQPGIVNEDPLDPNQAAPVDIGVSAPIATGTQNELPASLNATAGNNWAIAYLRVAQGAGAPATITKSNLIGLVEAREDGNYPFIHDDEGVDYDYYGAAIGFDSKIGAITLFAGA